jgi:hypothetical protein
LPFICVRRHVLQYRFQKPLCTCMSRKTAAVLVIDPIDG